MKPSFLRSNPVFLGVLCAALFFSSNPLFAVDGKKWDGGKYPFQSLNPLKANSESNPFIIDTAGKLAYLGWLAKCEIDVEAFGKKNGIIGLHPSFKGNYAKLTTDLDMNGSQHEFIPITGSWINFDGGGHVLYNLRISDKTTPPYINPDSGEAEITLALFEDVESVKNLGIGKGSSITFSSVSNLTLMVYAASLAVNANKIDNCFSDATITIKGNGESVIGGLTNTAHYLSNSYNRGSISFEGNVIDSRTKNKGKPAKPSWFKVGGVCASADKTITGCYNTGSITIKASASDANIGGVAADTNSSICTNLYNTGSITVTGTGNITTAAIGGVLGRGVPYPFNPKFKTNGYVDSGYIYNNGTIAVMVSTGTNICVGGVGGGLYDRKTSFSSAEFSGVNGYLNAYNTGSVSASSTGKAELSVGGIAGSGVMVFNCYNTGKISGSSAPGGQLNLGGLGGSHVYVQNSYNIGSVSGKGSGTNFVGGTTGLASLYWGESDRDWNPGINAFWLKEPKSGGINSDVKYGKGSYFYMKQGDIKKTAIGQIIDALDKTNPNQMVESGGGGSVYSFDSPTAAVMTRSDDDPGKRPSLTGTLLYNLNEMVEDKIDRLYRRWVIDGSNGGYPVLSSTATLYSRAPVAPDAATGALIAGSYTAVHKNWHDTVLFTADGSFKRATGGDGGSWTFDGKRLILKWSKWTPEILTLVSPLSFSCKAYNFTISRSPVSTSTDTTATVAVASGTVPAAPAVTPAPPTDKAVSAYVQSMCGTYYAVHKDWTDTLVLNTDGTFKRGTGEGGTWIWANRKLVLTWSKTAKEETLVMSSVGFSCLAYKFTMRR